MSSADWSGCPPHPPTACWADLVLLFPSPRSVSGLLVSPPPFFPSTTPDALTRLVVFCFCLPTPPPIFFFWRCLFQVEKHGTTEEPPKELFWRRGCRWILRFPSFGLFSSRELLTVLAEQVVFCAFLFLCSRQGPAGRGAQQSTTAPPLFWSVPRRFGPTQTLNEV